MYISQNYSYAILRPLQAQILAHGGEVRWFLAGNEVNPDFLDDDEQRLHTISDVRSWHPDITYIPGNIVPSFIPGKKVSTVLSFKFNFALELELIFLVCYGVFLLSTHLGLDLFQK